MCFFFWHPRWVSNFKPGQVARISLVDDGEFNFGEFQFDCYSECDVRDDIGHVCYRQVSSVATTRYKKCDRKKPSPITHPQNTRQQKTTNDIYVYRNSHKSSLVESRIHVNSSNTIAQQSGVHGFGNGQGVISKLELCELETQKSVVLSTNPLLVLLTGRCHTHTLLLKLPEAPTIPSHTFLFLFRVFSVF